MHRIGRQKFTKALVCATGASVIEVDSTTVPGPTAAATA